MGGCAIVGIESWEVPGFIGDHWLDFMLGSILLIFLIVGRKMGLIKGALLLFGLVVGIWFAGMWAGKLDEALISRWLSGSMSYYVSFLAIILLTSLVARFVGRVTRFGFVGSVNNIGGMVVGLLLGVFIAQAGVIVLSRVSFMQGPIEKSYIVDVTQPVTGWAVTILPDTPDWLKDAKDFLTDL